MDSEEVSSLKNQICGKSGLSKKAGPLILRYFGLCDEGRENCMPDSTREIYADLHSLDMQEKTKIYAAYCTCAVSEMLDNRPRSARRYSKTAQSFGREFLGIREGV